MNQSYEKENQYKTENNWKNMIDIRPLLKILSVLNQLELNIKFA